MISLFFNYFYYLFLLKSSDRYLLFYTRVVLIDCNIFKLMPMYSYFIIQFNILMKAKEKIVLKFLKLMKLIQPEGIRYCTILFRRKLKFNYNK